MSLKRDLVRGTVYMAIAKYSGMVITILVTAILSRILTPQDYGVVALATVMLTLFNILGDLGIGPAVIQNKTLTAQDMNSINTFNSYTGAFLALAFYFCSPLIADCYDNGEVEIVCKFMSFTILLNCVNAVPNNILYRQQRFKLVTILALISQVVGGIFSITMAYMGCGAVSLIIPGIFISSIMFFVLRYITGVHFVLKIDFTPLRRVFSFSAYQFFANLIAYLSRNVDSMLVGKFFGIKSLGYYNKSFNLMLMPLQYISSVLIPVMLPVFSNYQDDLQYIQDKYTRILRLFAFIGVPVCLILYFCAEELIFLFYGDQWGQSVPYFKILSISVPFQIMGCSSGAIFQATNNTKAMFWNGFIGAIVTLGSIALGVFVFETVEALAWGYTFAMVSTTFICFYIMYHYALKSSFLIWLRSMISPALFSIALCAMLLLASLISIDSDLVQLFVKLCIGVVFSVSYIHYFKYYDLAPLIFKVKDKLKDAVYKRG